MTPQPLPEHELETFYRDCYRYVRCLAARSFGATDADDITQEVMVRVVRSLPRLDLERPIKPWLATVTRNVGISYTKSRREVPIEHDTFDELLTSLPDEPAIAAERADQRRRLRHALRRVPPGDLNLLTRHEIDGVSLAQLARDEGVAANTVRQRLFRARGRLATQYRRLGGPVAVWLSSGQRWRRHRRAGRTGTCIASCVALALIIAMWPDEGDQRLLPIPVPLDTHSSPPPTFHPSVSDISTDHLLTAARSSDRRNISDQPEIIWHKIAGDHPPVTSGAHAITYDESRREYVLYLCSDTFGATWTSSDGVSWTKKSLLTLPRLSDAAMVYDAARRIVVLFGVTRSTLVGSMHVQQPASETWLWDGTSWTRPRLGARPPGSWDSAFVYDHSHQVAVLFGGRNQCHSETWVWDGKTWIKLSPRHHPPARQSAATAYSPALNKVVLFGGVTCQTAIGNPTDLSDTWLWNGQDWQEQSPPTTHSSLRATAMTSLPDGVLLIMHGNQAGYATVSSDGPLWIEPGRTWHWTGIDWEEVVAQIGQPGSVLLLAYNSFRGEVLLMSNSGTGPIKVHGTDVPVGSTSTATDIYIGQVTGHAPSPRSSPRPPDVAPAPTPSLFVPDPQSSGLESAARWESLLNLP